MRGGLYFFSRWGEKGRGDISAPLNMGRGRGDWGRIRRDGREFGAAFDDIDLPDSKVENTKNHFKIKMEKDVTRVLLFSRLDDEYFVC